ncbi:MAG: peptidoglycan editing factor PgeF [Tepidisphaeraceae bacterium]
MLKRRIGGNSAVFYVSPALEGVGVPHAFSTRLGGVSPAPFDSLNLGNPSGSDIQDEQGRIEANYLRLIADARCPDAELLRVHQIHGNRVAAVEAGKVFDRSQQADALVSDDPERTISVRVADCVPILIASGDGKMVAAVHAGWRGIVGGVIPATLARMTGGGKMAGEFVAAIGPCIGEEAFEVGGEVLAEFEKVFGRAAPVRRMADGKGRVDLRAAARMQLLAGGLREGRIDSTDRCTFEHRNEFFSHRRDRGVTGRMAALIAPAA